MVEEAGCVSEAATMLDVFKGCIETGKMPLKGSDCHVKVQTLINILTKSHDLLKMAEKALHDYMEIPNSMVGNRAIRYFTDKEELLGKTKTIHITE